MQAVYDLFANIARRIVEGRKTSGITIQGHAEVLVDLPGRVGAVEGVEVNAPDAVVEQVTALLGCPVDADTTDRLVVGTAVNGAEEASREAIRETIRQACRDPDGSDRRGLFKLEPPAEVDAYVAYG